MNIVVNEPLVSVPHVGLYQGRKIIFWPVARKPIKLNLGDNVFVAIDGQITHSYRFLGFAQDPKCESSGRIIPGLVLMLDVVMSCLPKFATVPKFRLFKYLAEDYFNGL